MNDVVFYLLSLFFFALYKYKNTNNSSTINMYCAGYLVCSWRCPGLEWHWGPPLDFQPRARPRLYGPKSRALLNYIFNYLLTSILTSTIEHLRRFVCIVSSRPVIYSALNFVVIHWVYFLRTLIDSESYTVERQGLRLARTWPDSTNNFRIP